MRSYLVLGAALAAFAGPLAALTLAPGDTVSAIDYEAAEVAAGDPDFFGALLGSFSASATETRDGFDGFEVIPDLYDVTGVIDVDVFSAVNGGTTFSYGFSSIDNSGAGSTNGVAVFSVSGFAGFSVALGWTYDLLPYVPAVERSLDGDTITVTYANPQDTLQAFGAPFERILLATDAPGFALSGTGTVDINIDSFGVTERDLRGLPAPVPVPAAGLLLAGGLGLLAVLRRRG